MRSVLLVVVLAGCLEDPTVDCGDHLCPSGTTCTPTSCAKPEDLAACVAHDEAAACSTSAITGGACKDGVCLPVVCGDAVIVGPEVCDDGNQFSGDGCSAACESLEVCGNNIIDVLQHEECDRGVYGLSRDGCTSTCTIEFPAWHDLTPALPIPRWVHTFAFDTKRSRGVMFSGLTTFLTADTWEWDGVTWRQRTSTASPTARDGAASAYDEERHATVLFGGRDAIPRSDTWTWDGISWAEQHPATVPPARQRHVMAYDPIRKEVVMFGGNPTATFGGAKLDDTWVWNGATWTERTPATKPPAGYDGSLAYDSTSQTLIFVPSSLAETWSWDGTTWTKLAPATTPPSRANASMSANPGGGIVMFGGNSSLADTWIWANGNWTNAMPATSPSGRGGARLVLDPANARAILFGGGSPFRNDTWQWNGTTWSEILVPIAPPSPEPMSYAYDRLRGSIVGFGGADTNTWIWDSTGWQRRMTATRPPARRDQVMLTLRDRVFMFGGSGGANTWTYDGDDWHERISTMVPPTDDAVGAYDSMRDRVVLFVQTRTFEWDPASGQWTELFPVHSPPARSNPAMAFDQTRGRTVLFGGRTTDNSQPLAPLNDVWEWDGTDWVDRTPTTGPAPLPRLLAALAFHETRGTIILYGGLFSAYNADVWEWDGTAWHQLELNSDLPARASHQLVFDAARDQIISLGGSAPGGDPIEMTSILFEATLHPTDGCTDIDSDGDDLVGCADPDCWARCTPLCPPGATCNPADPHCGDGTCSVLEDARLCPADCAP